MAKQGMARPDVTHTQPRNTEPPVPQIQGKAKPGKAKANPIVWYVSKCRPAVGGTLLLRLSAGRPASPTTTPRWDQAFGSAGPRPKRKREVRVSERSHPAESRNTVTAWRTPKNRNTFCP